MRLHTIAYTQADGNRFAAMINLDDVVWISAYQHTEGVRLMIHMRFSPDARVDFTVSGAADGWEVYRHLTEAWANAPEAEAVLREMYLGDRRN